MLEDSLRPPSPAQQERLGRSRGTHLEEVCLGGPCRLPLFPGAVGLHPTPTHTPTPTGWEPELGWPLGRAGGHSRRLGGLVSVVFLHDALEQTHGSRGRGVLGRRSGSGGCRAGVKEGKILCIREAGHGQRQERGWRESKGERLTDAGRRTKADGRVLSVCWTQLLCLGLFLALGGSPGRFK